MAQEVKGLLCKHKDLNLDPQNPCKRPGAAGVSVTPQQGSRERWVLGACSSQHG